MKIQFIGATHEVTGSCTLLEVNKGYYLVDCGMEQGRDVFQNIALPVPASEIAAVFVTHAHIDHSGMLPRLYREGFRGKIYATDVTRDLCDIMLRDSAHIQESEAEWRSRKSQRAGGDPIEPIYDMQDALGAISLFVGHSYGKIRQVADGISVRFTDIGHLLGSACIEMWLTEGSTTKKIVFSGDVGNNGQRIICDPRTVEETDYLVIESTYGNRIHEAVRKDTVAELAKQKAEEVAALPLAAGKSVLGADTVVALNGEILGKPKNAADAERMLVALSGNTHEVHTGVAVLRRGKIYSGAATTEVVFRELSEEEIAAYVATGEPLDKAGAYGIQGLGGALVARIAGEFDNVVGLPCRLADELLCRAIGEEV